jgi:hypothetical protein
MSIEKEVNHPEFDLVNCPNVDCPQYGEHIDCYFIYDNCPRYNRWYIKEIENTRDSRDDDKRNI